MRADTHYCDWDEPGRRFVRTLCRVLIPRREHQSDPTCPICRAVLEAREAERVDYPEPADR